MKILSSILVFLSGLSCYCATDEILTEILEVSKMTNDLLRINIYFVCFVSGILLYLSYKE